MANTGVNDLLLRLAEHRLFLPCFSDEILEEVFRTHVDKFGIPEEGAQAWQREVRKAFPEAIVENYQQLLPSCSNDQGDRHVLAAAIRGQAQLIVTFNLRHFGKEHLDPWDIRADHPQDYLITLYEMHPASVLQRLHEISDLREQELKDTLDHLSKSVPAFAHHVIDSVGL